MQIGILGGTGPAGSGLAARLASAGVDVIIGSRIQERADQACADIRQAWPDRTFSLTGHVNEIAAAADVVVVATPWDAAAGTVISLAAQLTGKVVISMANALTRMGTDFVPLMPSGGSIAAHIASAAPGAHVAAAFHHLPAKELADLSHPMKGDVLICSDHADAMATTAEIVRTIRDLRPIEAGRLAIAAPVEAMTAVLIQLNVRYKTQASLRITGIPD